MKITVEQYDNKYVVESKFNDQNIEQIHDLWLSILAAMRYHSDTIEEFYNNKE